MNDADERVILVDANDRPLGTAGKLDAHRRGDLHRAFSVLIGDGGGNLLLQKRHPAKYHSGGLWTNACCGHPRPDEGNLAAASRRLSEEMGFTCPLVSRRALVYRADVGNGLIEHEYVHIFAGRWCGVVSPDPAEAEAYAWRSLTSVRSEVAAAPERFTAWFQLYLSDLQELMSQVDSVVP
jgi:isopentenyl-diphosphate delta-isomerase